jgi:hypothetical protein
VRVGIYSAGQTQAALSAQALSQTALSGQAQAAAQALSTWQESAHSPLPHLLPQQEAKETATTAAKINAIFFIFLLFYTVKQSSCLKVATKVRHFAETTIRGNEKISFISLFFIPL